MSMVDKDINEVEAELAKELDMDPDDAEEYAELLDTLDEEDLVHPDERRVLWDEDDYEYYEDDLDGYY